MREKASACHTGVDKVTKSFPLHGRSVSSTQEKLGNMASFLFIYLYKSNAEQFPAFYMQVSE